MTSLDIFLKKISGKELSNLVIITSPIRNALWTFTFVAAISPVYIYCTLGSLAQEVDGHMFQWLVSISTAFFIIADSFDAFFLVYG